MRDRMHHETRRAFIAALQTGAAAGLAWWLAQLVLNSDQPLYAPIAAVVVIGAGYERRVERVTAMLGGMALAVAISEIGVRLFGTGAIQIGVFTAIAILIARRILDDLLAVTYAAVNAALLVSIGGDGWVPDRLLEGVIGAATAYALVYLVFPPRPLFYIRNGVRAQAEFAAANLRKVAEALRTADGSAAAHAEESTGGVDRRGGDLAGTFDFSQQVSRWSPWRRHERPETARLRQQARSLQIVLRDATALVRIAGWQLRSDPCQDDQLAEALEHLADAVATAGDVVGAPDHHRAQLLENVGAAVEAAETSAGFISPANRQSRAATAHGVLTVIGSLHQWTELSKAPDATSAWAKS